jgi:hypothetical protein
MTKMTAISGRPIPKIFIGIPQCRDSSPIFSI